MKRRMNLAELEPAAYKIIKDLVAYVKHTSLDERLQELVKIRASQLNNCSFCIDMHCFEARAIGETEQRLYTLSVWREVPYFTERERAALALTEAVTLLSSSQVPDDVYEEAAKHFTQNELAQLIMAIISINGLNRIGVTTRMFPQERK